MVDRLALQALIDSISLSEIDPKTETPDLSREELAGMIDHTLLKPEATVEQIHTLCKEARQFGFASVCVNPAYVKTCSRELKNDIPIASVVGFPLGASHPAVKAGEAIQALEDGAAELDMVINVGMLKSGELEYVEDDIRSVVEAAPDCIVKVIIETCLLTDEEKITACFLANQAGAHFVKTSTGFSTGGATTEDVALMRKVVGKEMGVKAAGGIRTREDVRAMIAAGASRIGASAGIKIVSGMGK